MEIVANDFFDFLSDGGADFASAVILLLMEKERTNQRSR